MAFGLPNEGGGDFLPLLSYSAKSGRFSVSEKVEAANGSFGKDERELKDADCVFLLDFSTAKKGWLLFRKGTAPMKVINDIADPMPPQPVGDFGVNTDGRPIRPQGGFVIHAMTSDRKLREFASNSNACVTGLGAVMDAYQKAPEAAQGMIPAVRLVDTKKVGKHGNYEPVFAIEKWVPRPEAMGDGPAATYSAPTAQPRASGFGVSQAEVAPAGGGGRMLEDTVPFGPEVR